MRLNDNQITHVNIKNYRSLADVSVELGRLNVLIGTNGSGKSNFVDALRFVADTLRLGLPSALAKHSPMTRFGNPLWYENNKDITIELFLKIDGLKRQYTFSFNDKYQVTHEKYISDQTVIFERNENQWITLPTAIRLAVQKQTLTLPIMEEVSEITPLYHFLTSMSFYNLFPDLIRLAPPAHRNPYPLDENGLNIASSLHEFLQSSQRSIDFVKTFKSIIPHVDRIETQEIGTAYLATVFHIGQQELDLPLESDGTLRVLATLVALFQDPPRTVLGLEEPELMVHPGVLGVLADAIKEASERSQMIITTHSPDLIASFDVNDLRVVERGENGTKIGKIDDSQRQIIEDQLFKASDLLRIHGELRGAVSSES